MNVSRVETLPLRKINMIDGNRDINQSHVQKMYDLIADNGFADTIKVVQRGKRYYAVEGQHRLESLRLHKIKEVPCSIIDWLGDDFEEIQSYIIDLNAHNIVGSKEFLPRGRRGFCAYHFHNGVIQHLADNTQIHLEISVDNRLIAGNDH